MRQAWLLSGLKTIQERKFLMLYPVEKFMDDRTKNISSIFGYDFYQDDLDPDT